MFTGRLFFLTLALALVLPARTAFAHDAPPIPPTRLDFDARQAPKNCNDRVEFKTLLGHWLAGDVLTPHADRQLKVRIDRTPIGGKLTDVTLMDATGTILAEHHERHRAQTECHKVLFEAAHAAARLMGAFEKPPEPEPCPICPPPPPPAEPVQCPVCPTRSRRPPRIVLPPPFMRRGFLGAGFFSGTGITPVGAIGPHVALGFVLLPHMPRIQFEIDGTWAPQILPASNSAEVLRVVVVPLVGSLCYARYVFRFCGGLATTVFSAERTSLIPGNDAMKITLAASARMGTEFEIAGPFSIRLDGFALVRLWEPTFDHNLARLNALNRLAMGAAAMGVWSFE